MGPPPQSDEDGSIIRGLNFVYPTDEEVITRLETDRRMVEAANILEKHVSTAEQMTEILGCIVAAKSKAERFQKSAAWPAGWNNELDAIDGSIDKLFAFFQPFAQSAPDASQLKAELHQLGDGLAWSRRFVADLRQQRPAALDADMPHSRKRDNPTITFCKILCGELQDRLGQPLCNFVGITVAVVFGVRGRIEEKTVQAAWAEEKKKRRLATSTQDSTP